MVRRLYRAVVVAVVSGVVVATPAAARVVTPASIPTHGKVSVVGAPPAHLLTQDYDAFGLRLGLGGEPSAIVNDPPLAWAGVLNGTVHLLGAFHGALVLPGTGGVEGSTSRLSIEGGFAPAGALRLDAFDCAGNLVGSTLNDDGVGPNGRSLMTLTAPGMHRFRVSQLDNTFVVTMVDYGDAIPCADADGDGVADRLDNCSAIANPGQADSDGDGTGDACDGDLDGDGAANGTDNCQAVPNADQRNLDGDGTGDACDGDVDGDGAANGTDNCQATPNADQRNLDGDGTGDACDGDIDGDGVANGVDNCPLVVNASQLDVEDADGIGDACDDSDGSKPPVPEQTVAARVTRGTVLIKAPGSGGRFVPLEGAETIPVGTVIDATNGAVKLTAAAVRPRRGARAAQASGAVQAAEFFAGVFQIRQIRIERARRRAQRLITRLRLRGASIATECGAAPSAGAARAATKVVRQLWGDGRGRFQTVGRRSSTTVRGTRWLTQDRCDGTLTRVERGQVAIKDVARERPITLRAGQSYLARGKVARRKGRPRPIGIPPRAPAHQIAHLQRR